MSEWQTIVSSGGGEAKVSELEAALAASEAAKTEKDATLSNTQAVLAVAMEASAAVFSGVGGDEAKVADETWATIVAGFVRTRTLAFAPISNQLLVVLNC